MWGLTDIEMLLCWFSVDQMCIISIIEIWMLFLSLHIIAGPDADDDNTWNILTIAWEVVRTNKVH